MVLKKSRKGLTLIEVIISIAILAIIVTPLSSLTMSAVKFNRESDYKQRALALAQKYMELVKSPEFIVVTEGAQPDIEEDGLIVTRTINPMTEYNFEAIQTNITNVNYTTKLDVYNKSEDEISDKVVIDNGTKKTLLFSNMADQNLTIINSQTETKIQIEKDGVIYDSEVVTNDVDKAPIIRVELHGSEKLTLSVTNDDKKKFLSLYFIKHKGSSKYTINSSMGKVKVYSDIAADAENTNPVGTSSPRVYKVKVEVKNANKEIIQTLEGYKTVVK